MSKYKSKVDPTPIGDTDGLNEFIETLKSGNELWLNHTTSPPSYYLTNRKNKIYKSISYYISDRQAKTLMDERGVTL